MFTRAVALAVRILMAASGAGDSLLVSESTVDVQGSVRAAAVINGGNGAVACVDGGKELE